MNHLTLSAIGWITLPTVLWGVGLGSIPTVIHLLKRRRYRETEWAAMQFLLAAARKQSRRIRLEQIVLLCLRTLLILFFVAALTGEFPESSSVSLGSSERVHRIVVIDTSYSMGAKSSGGRSRFDAARQNALQIVSGSNPGDMFHLLRIGNVADPFVVKEAVPLTDELQKEIETISLSEERGYLRRTLRAVSSALDDTAVEKIARKEVVIIGDFQTIDWFPEVSSERFQLRELISEITEKAELVFVDVTKDATNNLAVAELKMKEPFLLENRQFHLQATVRNDGSLRRSDVPLKLILNGKTVQETKIEIAAHSRTNFTFAYPRHRDAQEPLLFGEYKLEVRVEDHALEVDNARWLVLPVREQLRVLLINGNPSGSFHENPTFFLEKALAASRSSDEGTEYIVPEERTEQEFLQLDLNRYDCLFLCNVARFTETEVEKLRAFLDSGGGVVFVLGDRVDPRNYNEKLLEPGREILPAKIGDLVQVEPDGTQFHEFDTSNLTHPIVNLFAGNPGTGLDSAITFQYFQTETDENAHSQTVLKFKKSDTNPGDSVIVEKTVGRGQSVLITTSLDATWSTWSSTSPSFLPIVQELVRFAVRGRWRNDRFQVGDAVPLSLYGLEQTPQYSHRVRQPDGSVQPISARTSVGWQVEKDGCEYFVKKPKANSRPVGRLSAGTIVSTRKAEEGYSEIEIDGELFWIESKFLQRVSGSHMFYRETMQSGIYELLHRPAQEYSRMFAVNLDVRESDLAHVSQEDLQQEAFPGIEFHYQKRWEPLESKLHNISREENPVAQLLLGIAFSLLLVDLVMAWRFPYGLVLFGFLFAVWTIAAAFLWSVVLGMLVSTAICLLILLGWKSGAIKLRPN